jgi:hypothetical protein
LHLLDEGQAVCARQAEVRQYDVDGRVGEHAHGFADRARLHDVVAALGQDLRERLADVGLVFHDEHAPAG